MSGNKMEQDFEVLKKEAVAKLEQAGKLVQEAGAIAQKVRCGLRQMDPNVSDSFQDIIDEAGFVTEVEVPSWDSSNCY